MSDELAGWLLTQIDEDEAVALAVVDNSAPWNGQWAADSQGYGVRTRNGWVLAYGHGERPLPEGYARHSAHWDPARVLAECAAKRRIVEAHAELGHAPCDAHDSSGRSVSCEVLRVWVPIYADRPGCREEWRPDTSP